MKNLIRVHRFVKPDCLVSIMKDRATEKYCYVNLTSQHVCQCRFDTMEQALADLLTREDVKTFDFVKNIDIDVLGAFGLPKIKDISVTDHFAERDELVKKLKDLTIPDTCRDRDEWLEKGII